MEMSVSANDLSHKPGRRLSLLTGGQPPPLDQTPCRQKNS